MTLAGLEKISFDASTDNTSRLELSSRLVLFYFMLFIFLFSITYARLSEPLRDSLRKIHESNLRNGRYVVKLQLFSPR